MVLFSSRYNNPNTKVLLYQADYLLLGQTVSFKYKATTISNLLPSISVSSPVHLAYVTLSKSLAPREGRKYLQNLDQVGVEKRLLFLFKKGLSIITINHCKK